MNKGAFTKGHVPWNKGSGKAKQSASQALIYADFWGRRKVPYKKFDIDRKWWQFWKPVKKTFYRFPRFHSPAWKQAHSKPVKFRRYSELSKIK